MCKIMQNKILYYSIIGLIIIYFFSINTNIYSQTKTTVVNRKNLGLQNPEGKEFWLCFQNNYKEIKNQSSANELNLELFITGEYDANVVIEIEDLRFTKKIFVKGKTVANVIIDPDAIIESDEVPERLAIHVVSDNPIAVYGLNHRYQTTDSYLGIPTEVLGYNYRVMCYTVSDGLVSHFAVIATDDSTVVEITPTVETSTNRPALVPYKIYLRRGEIYQVKALNKQFSNCDLTGSLIKSNKKISVFSGHVCAYVPSKIFACNHLVEQMPPLQSWGKHYYIGKFQSRSRYSYRVLANEPLTKVFENNKLIKTLNEGEFYERESKENIQITADKPILVAQYSQGYRNGDSLGDPMMIMISPTLQFLRKYRFATPINGIWQHFVNVVAPTKAISNIRLNGVLLDSSIFEPLGISRYSIAYVNIPFGTYVLESDMPIGMYSYGFGYSRDAFDAYGTMGGQSFVDYEPVEDLIPPSAEITTNKNNCSIIFRDDRVDDTGIKSIVQLENNGLIIEIPKFDNGVSQVKIDIKPIDNKEYGRVVFEVADLAMNKTKYTLCYTLDPISNKFVYLLQEGIIEDCIPKPGIHIGLFGKATRIFHSDGFSSTGNVISKGTFESSNAFAGWAGLIASTRINTKIGISARISLDSYSGNQTAVDSIVSHYRDANGDLQNFQESRELEIDGIFMNISMACEWYFNQYFYGLAGLNCAIPLSKSITYTRKILYPQNFVYSNGKQELIESDINTLESMNTLRFGVFGGMGATYSFNRKISAFGELIYTNHLGSLVDDASWNIGQLSMQIGVKYRVFD